MEKRISYTQFQSVKSVAKACDPIHRQKEATKRKIEKLVEEYKGYQAQIDALQAGMVQVIGFPVESLVKKVIAVTGTDAKGNPVKTTKYLPTENVTYDEAAKQYIINIPDEPSFQSAGEADNEGAENGSVEQHSEVPEPQDVVMPTTADGPGSDFDADAGMPF